MKREIYRSNLAIGEKQRCKGSLTQAVGQCRDSNLCHYNAVPAARPEANNSDDDVD